MKKIKEGYKKVPQKDVACCECRKIRMDDIDGLEREAQDRISYDGRNIDPERSSMNLFVKGTDKNGNIIINNTKFGTSLKERILNTIKYFGAKIRTNKKDINDEKEISIGKENGHNTKESVVAIGIIFQLSHELAMKLLGKDNMLDKDGKIDKQKQLSKGCLTYKYFEDTYRFAIEKWGGSRIAGAYIHLDEYTPHMHLFVVPLMSKFKKYKNTYLKDQDGKPIKVHTLNAKVLFSRENVKNLWQEYAKAMAPYGARAATGLIPKGAYEKRASMDAVNAQKSQEIEEKEAELSLLEEEVEEKEKQREELEMQLDSHRKCLSLLEKMESIYVEEKRQLQKVFDKFKPTMGEVKVLDFFINKKTKFVTGPHGEKNEHVDWTYTVQYKTPENIVKTIEVKGDDYYQKKKDSIEAKISRFFFDDREQKEIAVKSHEIYKKGISF